MVSGEPPTLSGGPGSNTGKADREAAKGLQQQELCRLDSRYRTDALIYGRDVSLAWVSNKISIRYPQ